MRHHGGAQREKHRYGKAKNHRNSDAPALRLLSRWSGREKKRGGKHRETHRNAQKAQKTQKKYRETPKKYRETQKEHRKSTEKAQKKEESIRLAEGREANEGIRSPCAEERML